MSCGGLGHAGPEVEVKEDPDLPGWKVEHRTTSNGCKYKVFVAPNGKKCNSKFLMHYGFAIEKNREEDGKCMNEMPLTFALEVSRYASCCFQPFGSYVCTYIISVFHACCPPPPSDF